MIHFIKYPIIISAFSGSGKTYLAKKYNDFVDLEPLYYHWIYINQNIDDNNIELYKRNGNRILNFEWPENYIKEILKNSNKIVLISGADYFTEYFGKIGIDVLNIYPIIDQKEDYLNRFKKIGNNKEYIDFWNKKG